MKLHVAVVLAASTALVVGQGHISLSSSSIGGGDGQPTVPCVDYCSRSFAPHTSDQATGTVGACGQGCKLRSLLHFTAGASAAAESARECARTCADLYADADTADACKTGCKHPIHASEIRVDIDGDEPIYARAQRLLNADASSRFGGFLPRPSFFSNLWSNRHRAPLSVNVMAPPRQHLLGADGHEAMNPFAADFHAPSVDPVVRDVEHYQHRIDNFLRQMMRQFNDEWNGASMVDEPYMIEVNAGAPALHAAHGPEFDVAYDRDTPSEAHRPSVAHWLRCLRNRTRHLSAVARVVLTLTLCLLMCAVCAVCVQCCAKRRQRLYRAHLPYHISDHSALVKNQAPPSYHEVAKPEPQVHAPPPSYEDATPPVTKTAPTDEHCA